jgi:hypothetical protein
MIVKWEAVNQDEFQATWNGMLFTLGRTEERWRLWVYALRPGDVLEVNGREAALVKGSWPTAVAAKEAVDTAMTRDLKRKMAEAADKGAAVREHVGRADFAIIATGAALAMARTLRGAGGAS